MSIRLNPALPVLWRDPHSLQFGVGGRIVLDELTPGIEKLIAVLAAGTSHTGLRMHATRAGVSADDLAALLARLDPVLIDGPDSAPTPRVAIVGRGGIADELARQLTEAGARVGVDDDPELVVLITDHVVAADHHRRWLAEDRPHLGVIVGPEQVEVGPLVVPGAGACLYCVQLVRRDADPAWPALVTQLAALPPVHLGRTATVEAAARAARRILAAGALPAAGDGLVERLSVEDGLVTALRVARHPGCLCSAEPESDWRRADATSSPVAPSSVRAESVPA